MSSPSGQPENTTFVCAECSDSELSTVSNVMGILTFVAAVLGFVAFYFQGLRDSERDMDAAAMMMDASARDVDQLERTMEREAYKVRDSDARRHLQTLFEEARSAFREAEHFLQGPLGFRKRDTYRPAMVRIRERTQFVVQKEEVNRILEKLDKALSSLKSAARDILGRAPSDADVLISRVNARLGEMEAKAESMQAETRVSLEKLLELGQENHKLTTEILYSLNDMLGKMASRLEALEG